MKETTSPQTSPFAELGEKHSELMAKFVSNIRSGKVAGSTSLALATVTLLEQIISNSDDATAFELCGWVRAAGRAAAAATPHSPVSGNVARRVLRAIRLAHRQSADSTEESSLQRMVRGASARRLTLPRSAPHKDSLREHLQELRLELETSTSAICSAALQHTHAEEMILCHGADVLAERWLRAAAPRRYKLLLAEGATEEVQKTHAMAARLAAAAVPVTVVTFASVTGLMSRVNKVVMSVEAVLAGGAALARAGSLQVTTAAHYFSVPVLALAPLQQLSPSHAGGSQQGATETAPHALPYESLVEGAGDAFSPRLDFIPPDHVTLYITSLGGSSPSYIYRLLSELYDPIDYEL